VESSGHDKGTLRQRAQAICTACGRPSRSQVDRNHNRFLSLTPYCQRAFQSADFCDPTGGGQARTGLWEPRSGSKKREPSVNRIEQALRPILDRYGRISLSPASVRRTCGAPDHLHVFLESWPQCEWEFGGFGQVYRRFGIVSPWKETMAVATNFALRSANASDGPISRGCGLMPG
jgi:hypothetical protein